MVLSAEMNGLGKDYIWSELFQHINAAFLRKVEEIARAITDLYCNKTFARQTC